MNIATLPHTEESKSGFYPTPFSVAEKLLAGIDWKLVENILEPSAGKGDLAEAAARLWQIGNDCRTMMYSREEINIDAIEIDPNLRAILGHRFSHERRRELSARIEQGEKSLNDELCTIQHTQLNIVGDDFLAFDSRKQYNLIVMNPPFAQGDEHLLKAIRLQERYGGEIRCILNAETIRNPYTNQRKLLVKKLESFGADISFEEDAFLDSERATGVDIAIVKISIPAPKSESVIFEHLRKAAAVDEEPVSPTEMTVTDYIKSIVAQFKVECDAGLELIREYNAMKPYIMDSFEGEKNPFRKPILSLELGTSGYGSHEPISPNVFLEAVRQKYWRALLSNEEFMSQLTSNLREEYRNQVAAMTQYDFSEFNIRQIMYQMNAKMGKGIEETILGFFDKVTQEYSWYPEMSQNIHYFNGWKTNMVYKVNKKVILPCNGVFSSYAWRSDAFSVDTAYHILSDIEKVFNYLDGNSTEDIDLRSRLDFASKIGNTRKITTKYFLVTFYKKGTMHIEFTNQELLDRFNIYCCRHKNWLPPTYARKRYADLDQEEKAVVDQFHDGEQKGNPQKAYEKVMQNAQYYLAEPTQQMPALTANF